MVTIPARIQVRLGQGEVGVRNLLPCVCIPIANFAFHVGLCVLHFKFDEHKPVACADLMQGAECCI